MSTAGRPTDSAASDLSSAIREAGFVRLVVAADADSVAAAGVLAGALDEWGLPYQSSVTPLSEPASRATDADLTVAIGRRAGDITIGLDESAARTAYAVSREFGEPDLSLALAGAVAADGHPGDELAALARESGIERRPGVALPTADPVDGLAHSTLIYAPFSGDRDAVETHIDDLEVTETNDDERRHLASLVALSIAGDPDGTARGAKCVERALRPLVGGPFQTLGGYADVLDAVARERPGLAIVLALGGLEKQRALELWRTHARRAHRAIRDARTSRYDGLFVCRCDDEQPVGTVSRLVCSYRSPEPVVLAVGEGVAAAYATADAEIDVGETLAATAEASSETGSGTPRRGRIQFETEPTEFVAAFKDNL